MKKALLSGLVLLLISHCAAAFDIIAHRGASGYVPEHTLEAAVMAHAQNADYIEQDLVLTKDDIPIVLHDIYLETVTNVEQVFPSRARENGRWYVIDFSLAEIKQLQVHERTNSNGVAVFPTRYTGNGHFTIATFEEHITTIQELNRITDKHIGLYPEIKAPAFHLSEGKDISAIVIAVLRKYNLDSPNANIYVQCFDFNEVKRLKNELGLQAKLVQLIAKNSWGRSASDYDFLLTDRGLKEVAKVADGIGPWYPLILDMEDENKNLNARPWVKQAKHLGLLIHPFTFRADSLPQGITAVQLLDGLKSAGVDGVFTDQVPPVVKWRN